MNWRSGTQTPGWSVGSDGGKSWGWGRSQIDGYSNTALTPVTPAPNGFQGEHLANAIQFVSLFIPEIKGVNFSYGQISSQYSAITSNDFKSVVINQDDFRVIMDENQLTELLATVYHEGLHVQGGQSLRINILFDRVFNNDKRHSEIFDAESKFKTDYGLDFVRIYYGK